MRSVRLFLVGLLAPPLMAGVCASAQTGGGDWQKSYPVSGKASVTLSTGDGSVEVRSCGGCSAVRIGVEWRDRKPADYTLTEFQSGSHVDFELKEKPHMGMHFQIGNVRQPRVTVETPTALDLDAKTADGSLRVSGIQGSLQLHTSDGAVEVEDVAGAVRLTSSDGSIKIRNVTGTLESRSSDGPVSVEGKFTGLHVHSSDGSLDLILAEGTQLNTASQIETSDGPVRLRLPRSLGVDLDVHTSGGGISCSLPLTMDGYNSGRSSGHNLRGRLNAGGVPLNIHTSDGSVTIGTI